MAKSNRSRSRGLGKGLDALIPPGEAPRPGGVLQVSINAIAANPRQPREDMHEDGLDELAESIREHGILQPLIVTAREDQQGYTLIAGERRLQAAKRAGLSSVPVIVRQADERSSLEWALIENLQRKDLNPLEAARGYRQLAEDFELSHEEIAQRLGKSRPAISNTLRLLSLAPDVQSALTEGGISEGHARALLGLPTSQAQTAALRTVLKRALNVRQTEELVRKLGGERKRRSSPAKRTPEESALEKELQEELGTRVSLKRGPRGGRIVIRFYSDEELNALVDKILQK